MIKRTLYFGNPVSLSKKDSQLVVNFTGEEKSKVNIPIEDIGVVLLDHYQIVLTHALISALQENNVAIISCDEKHLPYGMMLPFWHNHSFTDKIRLQINMSEPLKKNLWQQTITAKINNQASLLEKIGVEAKNLRNWSRKVRSGDPDNLEARAAAYYWNNLFVEKEGFKRERFGDMPNGLLNYGYAILRAVIARSLVASGLLPALGIWHSNKYNAFCLADDVMEPYRPFVDELVLTIMEKEDDIEELTPALKTELLQIPAMDIEISKKKSPLMVGCQITTASLMQCIEGSAKKMKYPVLSFRKRG